MKFTKSLLSKKTNRKTTGVGDALIDTHSIVMIDAGIYSYNISSVSILEKIMFHISRIMQKYGSYKVQLPILQNKKHWEMSGRGNGYGTETFVVNGKDTWFLAPTAEEAAVLLCKEILISYKDLPVNIFQISSKFRDEIRPRGGLLRSKEFIMKDAYSFCSTPQEQVGEYVKMINAYIDIFNLLGLNGKYIISHTTDTGEIGGSLSHEILVISDQGDRELFIEPKVYTHFKDLNALSKDILTASDNAYKYIEAGHLFDLGKIYSTPMNAQFQTQSNIFANYYMGCYGIGVSRLLNIIVNSVESLPWCISPCFIYLVMRNDADDSVYQELSNKFNSENIWCNNTNNDLNDKLRFASSLKLPLIVVYNNNTDIQINYQNQTHKYNNINEVIRHLVSIYNNSDYTDFTRKYILDY